MHPKQEIETMDSELCKLVTEGNCEGVNELLDNNIEILRRVTPQGNSALHVAAARGHRRIAQLLVRRMPCILSMRNSNQETPLHTAARCGNSDVVEVLLDVQNRLQCNCNSSLCPQRTDLEASPIDVQEIWKAQNKRGETALHYAVKENYLKAVKPLLTHVKGIEMIVNNVGESPLYTACYYCCLEIGKRLLSVDSRVGDTRNDGTSCLHQAIANILELSHKRNVYTCRKFQKIERGYHRQWHDSALELASQLVSERPQLAKALDSSGNSPLHLLVALPFPDKSHLELVKQLLDAAPNMNFGLNKDDMAPIHIAARDGNVTVVRLLIESAPHCSYLLGKENKNALHFALEHDEGLTLLFKVECLLEVSVDKAFLINEPDNEGKTALRIANEALDKDPDKPLKHLVLQKLRRKTPPKSSQHSEKEVAGHKENGEPSKDDVEVNKSNESVSVVAALIATISFAAAFTIPGGFDQVSDSPVLLHQAALKAFVFFDSLALCLSIMSLIQFINNPSLGEHRIFYRYMRNILGRRETRKRLGTLEKFEQDFKLLALPFLFWSLRATVAAFATGVYVVIAPKCLRLAVTLCIITFCGLLLEPCFLYIIEIIVLIKMTMRISRNCGKRTSLLGSFVCALNFLPLFTRFS